jgi:hypothetical protein
MAQFSEFFDSNPSLLIRIDTTMTVGTSDGPKKASAKGEVVFEVKGDHPSRRGLAMVRFAIACASVQGSRGETGVISIIGMTSESVLHFASEERAEIDARINCQIHYEALDAARVQDRDKGCYYQPATEPCVATLKTVLTIRGSEITISGVDVHVSCMAGAFEEVVTLDAEQAAAEIRRTLPATGTLHYHLDSGTRPEDASLESSANTAYDPCISVTQRQLVVQPVGFRSSAADPNPTGFTAAAQFGTAQAVWVKGGIDISVRPMIIITDTTLKTSSNLTDIRASFSDPDPDVIECYFVDNQLPAIGGGSAGAIGTAACKVVVAEPNAGNPVLMAHELGHVLGLLHPGAGSNSDAGTVMAPTGSAMAPGTVFVTHFMTMNIANPVLQTLATSICLTHDKGNHYLRDFPVDAGLEPSDPLPAGMTRYSMSNVWNRLSNTPGTFGPTGPEHEGPFRFNPDLTPKTNFLFARVEQLNNLLVRNSEVKFYLKTPGSGGGASIQALGSVPVPSTLAVGSSQTVSMAWTVPPGTPNHSCVFGVVNSPAEPEGNPTVLNWIQFEDMSHIDNDWAQRNLDIGNVSPFNSVGDGNTVESAPFLIRFPADTEYRELPLRLTIGPAGQVPLASLELEIPMRRTIRLDPKQINEITIEEPLQAEEELYVILRATLPSDAPAVDYPVLIEPMLGRIPVIGWGVIFRVAKSAAVIAQLLDRSAAALVDFADLTDSPSANRLARNIAKLIADPPVTLQDLAKALPKVDVKSLTAMLALERAKALGLPDALTRLKRASASPRAYVELCGAFLSVTQRLMMAVRSEALPKAAERVAPGALAKKRRAGSMAG